MKKSQNNKSQIFSIGQKTKLAESRFKVAGGRAARALPLSGDNRL